MSTKAPPPVLDCARVLSYAFVDDIPYREAGTLFVDGKPLQQVPRLAICANLGEDTDPLLFHCDEEWNVLGCSGGDDVDQLKARAEKNYPGVASRWVDTDTSVEDALRYYDAQPGAEKCSFCGRRPFELKQWVEGENARICSDCIKKLSASVDQS